MKLAGIPTLYAPQTTGHPLGLPETPRKPTHLTVKPIGKRSDPQATLSDGKPPLQFWRSADGEPDPATHVAPPSIMQIKISRMLEDQASKLAEPPAAAEDPDEGDRPALIRATGEAEDPALPKGGADRKTPDPAAHPDKDRDRERNGYDVVASLSRSSVFRTLP